MSWLDPLVFSSVWVATAALALCLACAAAMGGWPPAWAPALAFCGTLAIYDLDRLRDLSRDRQTAPMRSVFVERHRSALLALTLVGALLSALLALRAGPRVAAWLLPVLLAGVFHRRLKRFGWWKPLYVSAAWTAVVVGLPALTLTAPHHIAWVGALVAASVTANAIASNLRDGEAVSARLGARVPLRIARSLAGTGLLISVLAPAPVRPLLCIPLTMLAALACFRAEERFGLVVVDGALLFGALLALPWYAG